MKSYGLDITVDLESSKENLLTIAILEFKDVKCLESYNDHTVPFYKFLTKLVNFPGNFNNFNKKLLKSPY